MHKIYDLALLRDKLEIVLFINQYIFSHGYCNEDIPMLFFTLQDELLELSIIYQEVQEELANHI